MITRRELAPLAAGLLGLAYAPAFASEPKRGGTLKLFWGTLDTADFHRHTGTISLVHPFAETLTSISKDGQPKPFLCESWEISPDGKVYTFRIRRNVKFHNGDTLTAQDVLANFNRIRNEVKGGWLTSAMKQVDAFETPDANTFVVRLKAPFAPFLNLLGEGWILSPKSPGWESNITKPIGTGPFSFDEWTPQLTLKGKRHREYWMAGKPYVDAVVFDVREIADASLGLRAGDFHGASVALGKLKLLREDPNITIDTRGDTSWSFVSFNNRKPVAPFDNVKVRQAIMYAVDKAALLRVEAGEHGILSNQMAAPGNFFFDEAMAQADLHKTPDLAKAKALLAEAGVDPSKHTARFILTADDRLGPMVMQMVKRLGFNTDGKTYDDLGYQKALSQYEWDVFPSGSGPRNDIFLRFVRLMSDGPNPHLWGGVQDPEFDKLVNQAIVTVDAAESRKFYLAAWQRVIDKYYTCAVGHTPAIYGYRKELKDMTIGFNTSGHRVDGGLAFCWLDV